MVDYTDISIEGISLDREIGFREGYKAREAGVSWRFRDPSWSDSYAQAWLDGWMESHDEEVAYHENRVNA